MLIACLEQNPYYLAGEIITLQILQSNLILYYNYSVLVYKGCKRSIAPEIFRRARADTYEFEGVIHRLG